MLYEVITGYWSVVAIGIGGMVGGGIFAVLGLAVQLAHGGTPIAFAIAGLVALLTSYSYAKLSVTYPSPGGTVEFLNQGLGTGLITGSLNVLLTISYIIMLSLYAHAFGSYGASFLPETWQTLGSHALISGAVVVLTFLNILGSGGMGKVYAATVSGRAVGLTEGDRVALKVVHPHLLETEGFFQRFLREAQLGASIRHENVVV